MNLTDILDSITIIHDYTRWQIPLCVAVIIPGSIIVLFILHCIIIHASNIKNGYNSRAEVLKCIGTAIYSLFYVSIIVWSIHIMASTPYTIKMQIAANQIPIETIEQYFTINDQTALSDNIIVTIEPKSDYYDETLNWYMASDSTKYHRE